MKITELETFVVGNPPPHFGGRYFIFLKLDHRRRRRGARRGLRGDVRPAPRRAHDRGGLRRARDRRRPVPHRAALARRLRQGLLRPAGHLAARRAQRDRDGVLGHRRQGRRQAGLRAARRARPRAPARLHVPLPRAGRRDRRLPRSRASPASGPRSTWHGASRRSSSIRRGTTRRSTPGSRASRSSTAASGTSGRCGRRSETSCDLLFGTHGQFTPVRRDPARQAPRGRTTRSGSRSRRRPSCRRRWRGWRARPRSRSRPESG